MIMNQYTITVSFPICAHNKPTMDEYMQDTVRRRTLETGIEEYLNLKRFTNLELT
jgi:hypothetical protein